MPRKTPVTSSRVTSLFAAITLLAPMVHVATGCPGADMRMAMLEQSLAGVEKKDEILSEKLDELLRNWRQVKDDVRELEERTRKMLARQFKFMGLAGAMNGKRILVVGGQGDSGKRSRTIQSYPLPRNIYLGFSGALQANNLSEITTIISGLERFAGYVEQRQPRRPREDMLAMTIPVGQCPPLDAKTFDCQPLGWQAEELLCVATVKGGGGEAYIIGIRDRHAVVIKDFRKKYLTEDGTEFPGYYSEEELHRWIDRNRSR